MEVIVFYLYGKFFRFDLLSFFSKVSAFSLEYYFQFREWIIGINHDV
jgi:hypothetical protein